jgi:hypothetical protein
VHRLLKYWLDVCFEKNNLLKQLKFRIMKKLEDFQKEKLELNFISGGNGKWVQTKKDPYTDQNGCIVTTTDSFHDANGDGKHQLTESLTVCASVDCGEV